MMHHPNPLLLTIQYTFTPNSITSGRTTGYNPLRQFLHFIIDLVAESIDEGLKGKKGIGNQRAGAPKVRKAIHASWGQFRTIGKPFTHRESSSEQSEDHSFAMTHVPNNRKAIHAPWSQFRTIGKSFTHRESSSEQSEGHSFTMTHVPNNQKAVHAPWIGFIEKALLQISSTIKT